MPRGFTRVFASMVPSIRRAELRVDFSHPLSGQPLAVGAGEPVPIYLHRAERADAPLVFELHGGGFALGGASKTDALRQALCRAGIHAVGVDYRKAPEHPYPAALEDLETVINWFLDNQTQLGLKAKKFFIMGESGGATLAAAAALDLPRALAGQILHYPLLDMAKPYEEREHFPGDFPPEMSRAFNEMYAPQGDYAAPRLSPLYASEESLRKAPPALIVAAGQDMLRSDAQAYAEKLRAAGVQVDYQEISGAHHGYVEDWYNPERYAAMTDENTQREHLDSFGRYAEKAVRKTIDFILSM